MDSTLSSVQQLQEWKKNTLLRTLGVPAQIRTSKLPNTTPKRYRLIWLLICWKWRKVFFWRFGRHVPKYKLSYCTDSSLPNQCHSTLDVSQIFRSTLFIWFPGWTTPVFPLNHITCFLSLYHNCTSAIDAAWSNIVWFISALCDMRSSLTPSF